MGNVFGATAYEKSFWHYDSTENLSAIVSCPHCFATGPQQLSIRRRLITQWDALAQVLAAIGVIPNCYAEHIILLP